MPDAWRDRIELPRIQYVLSAALQQSWFANHPAAIFHDLDWLRARLNALRAPFPPQTLHALAIKANPLVALLRFAVQLGVGLEAASMEEVHLALAAGCPVDRIVWDSPAKTGDELRHALDLGLVLNADNLTELDRIEQLLAGRDYPAGIGLRVNPEIGSGSIAATSVAADDSKFGVLARNFRQVLPWFERGSWLRGLHVHIGSQGYTIDQLVDGVHCVSALRDEVHRVLGREQISRMDIGGGLPTAYDDQTTIGDFEDYARALRGKVPTLFRPNVQLVTEFGRSIHANGGWAASRVEYVKADGDPVQIVIHLGADFMLRTAYQPEHWPHLVSLWNSDGSPKNGKLVACNVVGPLCFRGDVVARQVQLPMPSTGDWLVVHDTGAYTLSMWSRHCSRAIPIVIGYAGDRMIQWHVLRARESMEDIVRLWSPPATVHGMSRAADMSAEDRCQGHTVPLEMDTSQWSTSAHDRKRRCDHSR